MMGDGGFGAGEGLDFLEGFGMDEAEIPQAETDTLDQDAPLLEPLEDTIVKENNEQAAAEQLPVENDAEQLDKNETELQDEQLVPEQTTGVFMCCSTFQC